MSSPASTKHSNIDAIKGTSTTGGPTAEGVGSTAGIGVIAGGSRKGTAVTEVDESTTGEEANKTVMGEENRTRMKTCLERNRPEKDRPTKGRQGKIQDGVCKEMGLPKSLKG